MRKLPFLLLLAACPLPAAPAHLDIETQQDGNILLVRSGVPLSSAPIRFSVQRWQTREAEADAKNHSEEATVGSVLPEEKSVGGVLTAANDPSTDTGKTTLQVNGNTARQSWQFENDITVEATHEVMSDRLRISGSVSNEGEPDDIPLTLTLSIPIAQTNLHWPANLHEVLSADDPEERIDAVSTTAGARGAMSRYPFGGVFGNDGGIAVALPLDQPRIHRIRWDGATQTLAADIDVTLSPVTDKFPNHADFEFWIYTFDSEFAFRSMAAEYYALTPVSFENRVSKQGQWMPFSQIDSVDRVEDFGFAYHEYHPNVSVAYNTANDIESLVYCEPPVQYVNLAAGAPRTLENLRSIINGMNTVQGAQLRGSATHDSTGNIQAAWVETPWAVGARVPTNGDPDIPRTKHNPYNSFDANWKPYLDLYRDAAEDSPVDWQGDGRIVQGVIGATGRALYLGDGAAVRQPLQDGSTLSIRAKGSSGSMLSIRVGEETSEFPLTTEFTVVTVDSAAKSGDLLEMLAKSGDVYIDEVTLEGKLLPNGDFENGMRDSERVTGLYLDSFEGWDSKDLNFRAEHFPYVDIPLTFDARTGRTAQVNMMHSFEFAAEARRRLDSRSAILMANTALYQWCWSAHYLDVLGIETSWGEGTRINPPKESEMDYVRTMLRQKPYCYLLNVNYQNFRGPIVEQYFARCLHWGFWPGFFSHNAAESPYWQDPELYNADRPVFLRYTAVQRLLTESGWEPLTMAVTDNSDLLVERWGGGTWSESSAAPDEFSLTIYNPAEGDRTGRIVPDARLLEGRRYVALDLLKGRRVPLSPDDHGFEASLNSLEVGAIRYIADEADVLSDALSDQVQSISEILVKYRRHNMLDDADMKRAQELVDGGLPPVALAALEELVSDSIEPVYTEEWNRAMTSLRILSACTTEARTGHRFAPKLPHALVVGESIPVDIDAAFANVEVRLDIAGRVTNPKLDNGVLHLAVPADMAPGSRASLFIGPGDDENPSPWFETTLPVLGSVSFVELPQRLTLTEPRNLELRLANNLPVTQRGTLSVAVPADVSITALDPIELPPLGTVTIPLRINDVTRPAATDSKGQVTLVWKREGDAPLDIQAEIPTAVLAENASLLRHADVIVRVDSSYFGYDQKALTDGITDGRDLDWRDAAWASEEAMVPHWCEFTFPTPRELEEVTIHWAHDSGSHWTSRQVRIEGRESPTSPWKVLAIHRSDEPTSASTLTFERVALESLRLVQPAGDGPGTRPGLLWLSEVEAR